MRIFPDLYPLLRVVGRVVVSGEQWEGIVNLSFFVIRWVCQVVGVGWKWEE